MRFLTLDERRSWIGRSGPADTQNRALCRPNLESIPAVRVYHSMRTLLHWVRCAAEPNAAMLVLVTEHGTFPSCDHRYLYQCVRARFGNFGSIEDTPGHLLLGQENEEAAAVLFHAAISSWGVGVYANTSGRWFAFDHDGRVTIGSEADDLEMEVAQIERGLGVKT